MLCALSRNNEKTRALYIIKLKPSENCQSVDLLSMPQDASRVVKQLALQQGWFRDDGFN